MCIIPSASEITETLILYIVYNFMLTKKHKIKNVNQAASLGFLTTISKTRGWASHFKRPPSKHETYNLYNIFTILDQCRRR